MRTAAARPAAPTRLVGSAGNVCRILDCFRSAESTLSLTAIAREVALRPSSVHRLLRTLVHHDYVAFDRTTRRYRLGPGIARLVEAYREPTLAELARPVLAQLR